MPVQAILSDMEDIQQSIARVAPELDAIDASDLAPRAPRIGCVARASSVRLPMGEGRTLEAQATALQPAVLFSAPRPD